jgi:hypothetical protein
MLHSTGVSTLKKGGATSARVTSAAAQMRGREREYLEKVSLVEEAADEFDDLLSRRQRYRLDGQRSNKEERSTTKNEEERPAQVRTC